MIGERFMNCHLFPLQLLHNFELGVQGICHEKKRFVCLFYFAGVGVVDGNLVEVCIFFKGKLCLAGEGRWRDIGL